MSRRMLYEITMKAYSFDWDDNILHMSTMVNMDKKEGDRWVPVKLTTGEYAELKDNEDYRYPDNNIRAAFTDFDDDNLFIENVAESIRNKNFAPSFDDFKEALLGGKTMSIITARPQSPDTLKKGVKMIIDDYFTEEERNTMVENIKDNYDFTGETEEIIQKYIEANYYYPVSFKQRDVDIKKEKGVALDDFVKRTIEAFELMDKEKYNKIAIGFSDDDLENVQEVVKKIKEVMTKLYPQVEFYVYDTSEKGKNKVIVHTT
jgi:hypothetical protein|tara:strand:+ start:18101 stop:18883 length:783 start_codon:yes stop_codon:yes gene_type:complete